MLNMSQQSSNQRIQVVVVGAGVIGLSSALRIQQVCPEVQVTVLADRFSPNTTSDLAGGLWYPFTMMDSDSELVRQLGIRTFDYLIQLATSPLSHESGVHLISGYFLDENPNTEKFKWLPTVVLGYRSLTKRELDMFPGINAKCGCFFTSAMMEPTPYLQWLMKNFRERGGIFKHTKLESLDELYGTYDVVVNCSGLGAQDIVKDQTLRPVQGQILSIRAPWLHHFLFYRNWNDDSFSHVFPGSQFAAVGGTRVEGTWETRPNVNTALDIWENACSMWPALKGAEHVDTWVGLRPVRPTFRLEAETLTHGQKRLKVIHNYGHGGGGFSVHWGCAVKTADMVAASLHSCQHKAKL